ncbi:hypothetical protein [Acidithiobacillus ferrivorans]|uniref:hypothetical protein n=1 Tax=Acidithiobacillus ferrivorans TaxID=160808 RepID=UPI0029BFC72F|nr:hypothetical protein [Acidithiobacillus ferrivorans]
MKNIHHFFVMTAIIIPLGLAGCASNPGCDKTKAEASSAEAMAKQAQITANQALSKANANQQTAYDAITRANNAQKTANEAMRAANSATTNRTNGSQ